MLDKKLVLTLSIFYFFSYNYIEKNEGSAIFQQNWGKWRLLRLYLRILSTCYTR